MSIIFVIVMTITVFWEEANRNVLSSDRQRIVQE